VSWSAVDERRNGAADHVRYYGTSPTNLEQSRSVPGAGNTSYVVSDLAPGTYYFAVATLNSTGVASVVSNAASKTFP
jgi:hypothetical protein